MNESCAFSTGRMIWNLCRRGDEARLHFSSPKGRKIKVSPGPYPATDSPPDCRILFSSHRHRIKKYRTPNGVLYFLERVTRLELATSTLARWRSTG